MSPSRQSERGQAIVEFVFVLPFMVVLLFAIIEFGIAVNHGADMNQVASATARKLAVNHVDGFDPVGYAKLSAEESVAENPTFKLTVCLEGSTPGAAVAVKAEVEKTVHVLPGFTFGPKLHPTGRATMRLEAPANFDGADSAPALSTCQDG